MSHQRQTQKTGRFSLTRWESLVATAERLEDAAADSVGHARLRRWSPPIR